MDQLLHQLKVAMIHVDDAQTQLKHIQKMIAQLTQ
jgi:hypothetical protein